MSEFNQDNPKYIGFVGLLDAMCEEGLIQRTPDDKSSILVFRAGMDEAEYGVSEGWFSQSLHDAAQEAMEAFRNGDNGLFETLKEQGYEVSFTKDGEFKSLNKVGTEHQIPQETGIQSYDGDERHEAFPYEEETAALLKGMSKANLDRVFRYEECEIEHDFVGFLHSYKDLADILPKDFTIIDIGACQALQSEYFKDFANYIAVEPCVPEHAMAKQLNMDSFQMTGEQFIADVLPRLQEAGLDINKTFCVSSYVPDEKLRKEIIPQTFPHFRCVYCEEWNERLPAAALERQHEATKPREQRGGGER